MRTNDSLKDTRSSQRGAQPSRTRETKRSVGATAISASGARALGLARRDERRPYGRGETAMRVEADRRERADIRERDTRSNDIHSRPAVYTGTPKHQSVFSRLRLPSLSLGNGMRAIPIPLLVAIGLAIAIAVVAGPARTYYLAWRESGVLEAEYAALASQNEELNKQIERLQTLDGIEDEARERGFVYPDEQALVVEGVESQSAADPALVDAAVKEYEKSLPWYVGILDMLFGYTHE